MILLHRCLSIVIPGLLWYVLKNGKDARMSADNGQISDIPGGEASESTPEIELTMEPLQPRRAATRQDRQRRPRSPLPMLRPASPVSIPVPDPQTPAPMA